MKVHHFYGRAYGVILLVLVGMLVMAAEVCAIPVGNYDTQISLEDLKKEIQKDPDQYMDLMKKSLRLGNLAEVGGLAEMIITVQPGNFEAQAMHGIYLISVGDEEKARQEIAAAGRVGKKNQFLLYAEAMLKQRQKKYDEAIRLCREAINLDLTHPYAWNILGRIYSERGDNTQAISSYKKAVALEPKFAAGYTNLGAITFLEGQVSQALEYFKQALELSPASFQAHYGIAVAYETLGNSESALQEYKKCHALEPSRSELLGQIGTLQLKLGHYKDAAITGRQMEAQGAVQAPEVLGDALLHLGDIRQAGEILEKVSGADVNSTYLLGFVRMVEGNYEQALEKMQQVLQRAPDHFGAYSARETVSLYLGRHGDHSGEKKNSWNDELTKLLQFISGCAQAQGGDFTGAISNWRQAEGLISGFSIAGIDEKTLAASLNKDEAKHLCLGVLYYFKNLHEYALREFNQALKVNSASAMANYWAAQIYLIRGDRARALGLLNNSLEKAPRFFTALYTVGELEFLNGRSEEAVKYYVRALSVKKDAGVLVKLGLLAERRGDNSQAEHYYSETISQYPDLFVGYNQLAWLYAKQGRNLDKGLELAGKAEKLQPGNKGILDTIGWIYYQKKDFGKALQNVKKANAAGSNDPTVLYHLGAIYNAMGKNTESHEYLKKALEISGNFEEVEETRKLLGQ